MLEDLLGPIQKHQIIRSVNVMWGFPGGSDGKESTYTAGDLDSIPRSGRFPGEGHGNPWRILAWKIP